MAPDGVSAMVSAGVLNLTHRESHAEPQPLAPGEIYADCRLQIMCIHVLRSMLYVLHF